MLSRFPHLDDLQLAALRTTLHQAAHCVVRQLDACRWLPGADVADTAEMADVVTDSIRPLLTATFLAYAIDPHTAANLQCALAGRIREHALALAESVVSAS